MDGQALRVTLFGDQPIPSKCQTSHQYKSAWVPVRTRYRLSWSCFQISNQSGFRWHSR